MLSKLWKSSCQRNVRRRAFDQFERFRKDARGGVMVYTAFAFPMLLGVTGLSLDVNTWYMEKRITQAAADAAALSGALSIHRLADDSDLTAAATEGASANGYDSSDARPLGC